MMAEQAYFTAWLTGQPLTATQQAALCRHIGQGSYRVLLFDAPAEAVCAVWQQAFPPADGSWADALPHPADPAAPAQAVVFWPNTQELSAAQAAQLVCDTLQTEYFIDARVGISAPAAGLPQGETALQQAAECLQLAASGQATGVAVWENTALARLIQALPLSVCSQFCSQLGNGSMQAIDEETIRTAEAFIAHDLSLSRTASALFIHRNTLLYRLDKLARDTGYDLRRAQDMAVFICFLQCKRRLDSLKKA